MVDGRGGVDGVLEVVLMDDVEFASVFHDGDHAPVRAEVDVAVCTDGGGAELAGSIKAFAVEQFAVLGINRSEQTAVAHHVNHTVVKQR